MHKGHNYALLTNDDFDTAYAQQQQENEFLHASQRTHLDDRAGEVRTLNCRGRAAVRDNIWRFHH